MWVWFPSHWDPITEWCCIGTGNRTVCLRSGLGCDLWASKFCVRSSCRPVSLITPTKLTWIADVTRCWTLGNRSDKTFSHRVYLVLMSFVYITNAHSNKAESPISKKVPFSKYTGISTRKRSHPISRVRSPAFIVTYFSSILTTISLIDPDKSVYLLTLWI